MGGDGGEEGGDAPVPYRQHCRCTAAVTGRGQGWESRRSRGMGAGLMAGVGRAARWRPVEMVGGRGGACRAVAAAGHGLGAFRGWPLRRGGVEEYWPPRTVGPGQGGVNAEGARGFFREWGWREWSSESSEDSALFLKTVYAATSGHLYTARRKDRDVQG